MMKIMTAVLTIKSDVRLRIATRIAKLSPDYMQKAGARVASIIGIWLDQPEQSSIKNIGLFSSMKDEIATQFVAQELQSRKINACYPMILDGAMSFQVNPDVIFVPGRAFDKAGHRLGRGQSYYDRYFAQQVMPPLLIGIALDEQILSKIPTEAHDMSMDYICTPSLGLLKTTKGI